MTDIRQTLIDHGWRQGALVRAMNDPSFSKFAHFALEENDLFLIISQTCDLVNADFTSEPFFEALRLSPLEKDPENEYKGGKNSRILQFQINVNDLPQSLQALPYERFFINRKLLLDYSPEEFIREGEQIMINAWLTRRITRTAFPDKFEKRWKHRRDKITKIIKRLTLVIDIYIKITPFSDIEDDSDYELEIYLLMDADDFDNPETYAKYTKLKKDLEDQFNQCTGIDLQSIELTSDAEITLRELQQLRRWDYSYLSYREPSIHATPIILD